MDPGSPALQADFLLSEPPGKQAPDYPNYLYPKLMVFLIRSQAASVQIFKLLGESKTFIQQMFDPLLCVQYWVFFSESDRQGPCPWTLEV